MDAILEGLAAATELDRRRNERPHEHLQLLPLQHEFMCDPALLKQMRCGNKTQGKTFAGYLEGIAHSLGEHPFYEVPPPPTRGAIVFPTQGSYIKEGEELWKLLPKDEIDPSCQWVNGHGFGGRFPHIPWKNGSITYMIWTGSGGALNLAGPGYDWVHFNEPPRSSRVFSEIKNRTIRGNPGRMWLTFTPVNAPIDYIREMCEHGTISDHHRALTPEAMVPVGSNRPIVLDNGTICNALWVQQLRANTLAHERPVVIDGEWEFRIASNIFSVFRASGPLAHVTASLPTSDVGLRTGTDHGSGANFSQTSLFIAVEPPKRFGHYPKVWVLDEYVSSGETTEFEDAAAMVSMLGTWDKRWSDLEFAIGDRPWEGGKNRLKRKDNERLARAIEKELSISRGTLDPQIVTAKTGKGRGGSASVQMGCAFLHRLMLRPGHFNVHPKCERLISAFGRWAGGDDEWKHIIDPLRYALDDYVFRDYDDGFVPPTVAAY